MQRGSRHTKMHMTTACMPPEKCIEFVMGGFMTAKNQPEQRRKRPNNMLGGLLVSNTGCNQNQTKSVI